MLYNILVFELHENKDPVVKYNLDVLHRMVPSGVTRHVNRQEVLKVKQTNKHDDVYFTQYFPKLLSPVMFFQDTPRNIHRTESSETNLLKNPAA